MEGHPVVPEAVRVSPVAPKDQVTLKVQEPPVNTIPSVTESYEVRSVLTSFEPTVNRLTS